MDRKLVLLVGSSPTTRAFTETLLEKGHRVMSVARVAEALRVMDAIRPSLVMFDAHTRKDLEDLLREMRERGIRLPVVLVATSRNARRWAREFGVPGFIPRAGPSTNVAGRPSNARSRPRR